MKLTSREEDYLETIYRLSLESDTVGITDVARERGVTLPTVISAVSRLKGNGLVRQQPYGKIFLSRSGIRKAEEIFQAHRTLNTFLTEVLRIPEETAEKEACRMEHGLSKETLRRLTTFLDFIMNCPARDSRSLDKRFNNKNRKLSCQ